jgi:hypothetical protein
MEPRGTPLYISGLPHVLDPEFYLRDKYWNGITHSVLIVELKYNELAQKIVDESIRRGIQVVGRTPAIQQEIHEHLKSKSAA